MVLESVLTTKDGQEQVDEEVGAAATLEEDSEGREHDGADDLDDVAERGVSWCHCGGGGTIDASCPATGATEQCDCKTYDPVKGIVAVVDVVVLLMVVVVWVGMI